MNCILLHGLGQQASAWDGVCAHLPESIHTEQPDLANFFQDGTYHDLYHAFVSYCDGVEEPFALCGLSLGAVLALHYTLEHPERVKALCLIAPQYRMPKHLMIVQDFIFRLLPASAFEETGLSRQQMRRLTRSMMTLDFTHELHRLNLPVRILCGQQDQANQKAAQELADRIPGAVLHWISGAGHEINQQCPERLADELTEFLCREGTGERADSAE